MSEVSAAVARDRVTDPSPTWQVVHRVVFPVDRDLDTLPLYVDFGVAYTADEESETGYAPASSPQHADYVVSRRTFSVPASQRVSFGTYFNAFPAGYWRRWTDVGEVRLTLKVRGNSSVIVYRSSARGHAQRVASEVVTASGEVVFDLPLSTFGDGGWYWFDVAAGFEDAIVSDAEWSVSPARSRGTATVAVTTFNRPDYCVAQLRNFGAAGAVLDLVDQIVIVDQGSRRVRDEPGFEDASRALADRVQVIEQPNLGGSGGFARGMLETVAAGRSRYVLLLDDDVLLETESLLRAVAFSDHCRRTSIVGGHMLNMYDRSTLHTWGEAVNQYRFFWGAVPGFKEGHNFAQQNLRSTPWLHKRCDVDYNGWWMCLIPTDVVREIGLALPVFIKWDDSEFGLRARRAGVRTVTLPGAAVWHVPWTDKDDTIDWQAYFHQRNRWLVALLYSPYRRGGNLPKESFMVDVKHLLSQQYSAVELRLQALEDLLDGPHRLHADLDTKLAHIRAVRSEFTDSRVLADPGVFPESWLPKPPRRGKRPTRPRTLVQGVTAAASSALRSLRPVRPTATAQPEAEIAAMDARWWMVSRFDSALVTTADGTGASWYQRQPETFRRLLARSLRLHERLLREWDVLTGEYRRSHSELVSFEQWEKTFGIGSQQE